MIQAVLLFLLLIVILGIGGKWLRLPQKRRGGPALEQARRCPVCRSFVIGRMPARCDRADCPHG
jgi:hypothetical protein